MNKEKKIRIWIGKISFFCWFLILFGCQKDYLNPDKYSSFSYAPTIAFPLGYVDYTIRDLVAKMDSTVQIGEDVDKVVEILYKDSIAPTIFTDQVNLQSQQFNSSLVLGIPQAITLPVGQFTLSVLDQKDFNFAVDHNERIDSIFLKSTSIKVSVTSHMPGNVEFHLTLLSLKDSNGNPVDLNIPLNYNGTLPVSMFTTLSAGGLKCDLTKDGTSYNTFSLQAYMKVSSVGATTTFFPNDSLNFSIEVLNPKFISAFGYMGNYTFQIPPVDTDLNFFKNNLEGSIYFDRPKVSLDIYNSAGLPVKMNFDSFDFTLGNGQLDSVAGSFKTNGFLINAPTINQVGTYIKSSLVIDNSNSNLFDLLQQNPTKMHLASSVTSNPDNNVAMKNFITDSSGVIPVIKASLPLSLRIVNLTGRLNYKLKNQDMNTDNIKDIQLKVWTENGLPLGGNLTLVFLDSTGLDSLNLFNGALDILKPAEIDQNGFPISTVTDSVTIDLTGDEIKKIIKSKSFMSTVVLNTAGSANPAVYAKITLDQRLKVNLALKGNFNIEVNKK
jgi:hypothetical protein